MKSKICFLCWVASLLLTPLPTFALTYQLDEPYHPDTFKPRLDDSFPENIEDYVLDESAASAGVNLYSDRGAANRSPAVLGPATDQPVDYEISEEDSL